MALSDMPRTSWLATQRQGPLYFRTRPRREGQTSCSATCAAFMPLKIAQSAGRSHKPAISPDGIYPRSQ
jgi:hypothetical protein